MRRLRISRSISVELKNERFRARFGRSISVGLGRTGCSGVAPQVLMSAAAAGVRMGSRSPDIVITSSLISAFQTKVGRLGLIASVVRTCPPPRPVPADLKRIADASVSANTRALRRLKQGTGPPNQTKETRQ